MQHKFVKFIGEYKDLKQMGFKFQRLYANNYMQWVYNPIVEKKGRDQYTNIRVWKKGTEVTHDELSPSQFAFIVEEVILGNYVITPKIYEHKLTGTLCRYEYFVNRETDEITFDSKFYDEDHKRYWDLYFKIKNEGGTIDDISDNELEKWYSKAISQYDLQCLEIMHVNNMLEIGTAT